MSTVQWYDEQGYLLQDGPTLLVEDLQADFTAYAKTDYRGCLSEAVPIEVAVYLPEADFATEPQSGVTTETRSGVRAASCISLLYLCLDIWRR